MPFDKSPQNLIPGWEPKDSGFVVPASFLQDLAKQQADPKTGDSRAIVYAFIEAFYQWFNKLDYDSRPGKLEISRSSYIDDQTNTVNRSYTFSVETLLSGLTVAEEKKEQENED